VACIQNRTLFESRSGRYSPDYDQDVDPALFNDSGGQPVTCLVNVLYPWTTWAAVNAALVEGRN
jgi:hypothetical protein